MIQPVASVILNVFLWVSVGFIFGCQTDSGHKKDSAMTAPGAARGGPASVSVPPEQLRSVAEDSFIYGYPLVLMEITKDQLTNVPRPSDENAPINQFAHKATFPDAGFKSVVRPNFDTLYSSAWLDLSKEPMVLSVPDTGKRYYLMPMLSAWSDVFASPGSRTTGNKKGDFAITGPNWNGSLPDGVTQVKSPTNDVWIIGRTQTNGKADYKAVQTMQKEYRLTPLSRWGTNYTPPTNVPVKPGVDTATAPMDQVEGLTGVAFFQRMAESLKNNPPNPADTAMVEKLRTMGVVPGQSFDVVKLNPDQVKAINEGARRGLAKIVDSGRQSQAEKINGWVYNFETGNYGTNYLNRAFTAKMGLGANVPQDAVYPYTAEDSAGRPLNGRNQYVMRFAKGQLPPVDAFWSLTVYDMRGFPVKNSLNRFALGDRDRLRYNKDGSLEIYIQNARPEPSKVSNWLPAPPTSFTVLGRLYSPKEAVLNRQWRMPGLQRVEGLNQLSKSEESLR